MPTRPATFKTEPLKKDREDTGWTNLVVSFDGTEFKTFVNGRRDRNSQFETEITQEGITIKRRSDNTTLAKIPVHVDDNVPKDTMYVFDSDMSMTKLSDTIQDSGIFDPEEFTDSILNKVTFSEPLKQDHSKKYPFAIFEDIPNRATAESALALYKQNMINAKDYKELLENTFIRTSLGIDPITGKTDEELFKETVNGAKDIKLEKHKGHVSSGIWGSTINYKFIPEP